MTDRMPFSPPPAPPTPDGRINAPSAERNLEPILNVLASVAPTQGRAVELASGTGQHIARFAVAHPGVIWTPTDISPDRIGSVVAWARYLGCSNENAPVVMDASQVWPPDLADLDLIVVVNLFHLVSEEAAALIIGNAAKALGPGGRLFVYGPFRTEGAFRSSADAAFHADLIRQDPRIGYKDAEWLTERMEQAGLSPMPRIEMPANNLSLIAER